MWDMARPGEARKAGPQEEKAALCLAVSQTRDLKCNVRKASQIGLKGPRPGEEEEHQQSNEMRQLLDMLPLQANVFSGNGRAIFVSSIVNMQTKTLNDLRYK